MKKLVVGILVLAVSLGIAVKLNAADTTAQTEKAKIDLPHSKATVTETTKDGEVVKAEVDKTAKGTQPILKKIVKFDSVSKDGQYITVIDRDQKVRYMTNDSKRPYVVKWQKMDPIEITATYDVGAGQYVVDQAMITPIKQPMKEISKDDINKKLTEDAPAQPVEKKK